MKMEKNSQQTARLTLWHGSSRLQLNGRTSFALNTVGRN